MNARDALLERIKDALEEMGRELTHWSELWYFVTQKQFEMLVLEPGITFDASGRLFGVQILIGPKEGRFKDDAVVATTQYEVFANYNEILMRPKLVSND